MFKIDGKELKISKGKSVLEIAQANGVHIEAMCNYDGLKNVGSCGLCIAKDTKSGEIVHTCKIVPTEGMKLSTTDEEVVAQRAAAMAVVLEDHKYKCGDCSHLGDCTIISTSARLGVKKDFTKTEMTVKDITQFHTEGGLVIDEEKCILCGRCVEACKDNAGVKAIRYGHNYYGSQHEDKRISLVLDEKDCVYCGQCVVACPVDAIREKCEIDIIKEKISDPNIKVVVAMAPATRASIGDMFGFKAGANVEGKLYASLRELGFDTIFDLNFAADVTIMEEGTELLKRIKNDMTLPMITSCCPGWLLNVYKNRPEFVRNLSTTKSPQQIYGALTKSYYAEHMGWDPKKMYVVSIVPCTAKKYEKDNPEQANGGIQNVDAVLTSRDLGKMIKAAKIDFANLEDGKADDIMAQYTGAGAIFGQSGGVMEASLRFAHQVVEGKPLEYIVKPIRGMKGIKTADITLGGVDYKIAVVNGNNNLETFIDEFMWKDKYLFVEVMACTGGCIAGGGQPYHTVTKESDLIATKKARIATLQKIDKDIELKSVEENPMIKKLYKDYLGKPYGEKAADLLHVNQENVYEHYNKSTELRGTFEKEGH